MVWFLTLDHPLMPSVTMVIAARVTDPPWVARMTAVNVLEGVNELTDGTGGSADVATVAEFGPYRKSHKLAAHRRRMKAGGGAWPPA